MGVLTEHQISAITVSDIQNLSEVSIVASSENSFESANTEAQRSSSDSGIHESVDLNLSSEEESPGGKKRTRQYVPPDKLTRKRLSNPKKWKRNMTKKKLQEGEEYVTSKGKHKRGRCLQPPCDEFCRKKCAEEVTAETREKIFHHFWKKITSWQSKWLFISGLVREYDKKSGAEQTTRKKTREYSLP